MNHEQPTPSLQGSCHCGAVRLTLPTAPDKATSCNCSLCRRTGGIWAYYQFGTVSVQGRPENTESYVWGDRTLSNVRCKICGSVTHWEPLNAEPGARHGVNLRNFEPALLESVGGRRFAGADTWKFFDLALAATAAPRTARRGRCRTIQPGEIQRMDRVVVPQQRNHSLEIVQLCANGVHQNQGRASACGVVAQP